VQSEGPSTSPIDRFTLQLWLGISLYLLLNAISQGLMSATADLDQAEQLLLSQSWSLGYGPQPPLYTYLVKLVFLITGPALWPLLGLKVILLSLLVATLLQIGQQLDFRRDQQLLVVCGLALIPQFIWESQRDLTHSVLATAMAACTLLQLLRLTQRPSWGNHALLGLAVAAGLLSKYNVAIFDAGLLLTALSVPRCRQALARPQLLLAIGTAVLLLAPHLSWVLSHSDLALSSMAKTRRPDALPGSGLLSALTAGIAFLTPFWIAALALIWPNRASLNQAPVARSPGQTLLQRLPLVVIAVLLVVVLTSGATRIKDRWYQTMLFAVPVSAASLVSPLPANQLRWAIRAGVAAAGSAALLLPGRTALAALTGKTSRPNYPLPQLVAAIQQRHGMPDLVLASNGLIGGNVRLTLPEIRVLTPQALERGAPLRIKSAAPGSRLLVLVDRRDTTESIAPLLASVLAPTPLDSRQEQRPRIAWQQLTLPLRWSRNKPYAIQYAWIELPERPQRNPSRTNS
jgi:4-amino-4-deoxy-L-arabinose transferase-like glycosyltransferase